jgi:hypothetical protein
VVAAEPLHGVHPEFKLCAGGETSGICPTETLTGAGEDTVGNEVQYIERRFIRATGIMAEQEEIFHLNAELDLLDRIANVGDEEKVESVLDANEPIDDAVSESSSISSLPLDELNEISNLLNPKLPQGIGSNQKGGITDEKSLIDEKRQIVHNISRLNEENSSLLNYLQSYEESTNFIENLLQ